MPRNRFSFAIRVGREKDLVAALRFLLELLNQFFFSFYNSILGRKILFDVYAQLGGGKIPHMPH